MVAASSDLKLDAKEAYFNDDFQMALDLFDRAIETGPITAELYADRAQVHIKLGNHAEAVTDCDSALNMDLSLVKAYCRKGISYMKMKQFQNAMKAVQSGLSFAPGDLNLARLLNDCAGLLDNEVSTVKKKSYCGNLSTLNDGTEPVPEEVSIAKKCDCSEAKLVPVSPTRNADDANPVSVKQKRSIRKKKGSWGLDLEFPAPGQPKVFITYDKRMMNHRPRSTANEEKALRIKKIIEKLEKREHALSVHCEEYIQFIEALPLTGRELKPYKGFIADNNFVSSLGTPLAVFLAAGAVTEACRQVVSGKFQSAFAIVRPPGHHAKADKASGFCFFNNIAIAARYLQAEHNVNKILIVDFDVHHGDGTQDIFYEDKSVLFCSVHRHDIFPFEAAEKTCDKIGSGEGIGYNVNVSLAHSLKDDDLLAVFDHVFLPLAKQFRPEFVLVSAGFDAGINDIGGSVVSSSCFHELVWRLKSILNGKIVLALEGGYDFESLSCSCAESVKALIEGRAEDMEQKYEEANENTWKAIELVRNQFGAFWPILLEEVRPPEEYFIEPPEDKVLEATEPLEDKDLT